MATKKTTRKPVPNYPSFYGSVEPRHPTREALNRALRTLLDNKSEQARASGMSEAAQYVLDNATVMFREGMDLQAVKLREIGNAIERDATSRYTSSLANSNHDLFIEEAFALLTDAQLDKLAESGTAR